MYVLSLSPAIGVMPSARPYPVAGGAMTPVCRGLCRGRCRVLKGTTLGHICGALPWVLSVPQPGPLSCEGGGATPHPPSINCDGGRAIRSLSRALVWLYLLCCELWAILYRLGHAVGGGQRRSPAAGVGATATMHSGRVAQVKPVVSHQF